jgi:hypothetical protein
MAELMSDDVQRVGEVVEGDVVAVAEYHLVAVAVPVRVVVAGWRVSWSIVDASQESEAVV